MLIVKYNSLLSSLQWQNVSQNVTLRSDEELKIALAEMKNKMLEVQIKMKQNLNMRYRKDVKIQVLQQYFAKVILGGKGGILKNDDCGQNYSYTKSTFSYQTLWRYQWRAYNLHVFPLTPWVGNINMCLVCGRIAGWFVFLSRGEENVDKGRGQV